MGCFISQTLLPMASKIWSFSPLNTLEWIPELLTLSLAPWMVKEIMCLGMWGVPGWTGPGDFCLRGLVLAVLGRKHSCE